MRYAPEPQDRYLEVSFDDGGVVATDPPEPGEDDHRSPVRDLVKASILANLPADSKTEVAAVLDRRRDDKTLIAAWGELEREGRIRQAEDGHWAVVVVPQSLGATDTTTGAGGLVEGSGSLGPIRPLEPAPPPPRQYQVWHDPQVGDWRLRVVDVSDAAAEVRVESQNGDAGRRLRIPLEQFGTKLRRLA